MKEPYVDDTNLVRAYRRSAQIDREEADGLDLDDPRLIEVLDSAIEFDALADELEYVEEREVIRRPAIETVYLPGDDPNTERNKR